MIEGLSHLTFIVRDLDKMEEILTKVLDARKIYDSGDQSFSLSKKRFFDISGIWVAIMEGEALSEKTYNHVAFKISPDDYETRLKCVRALGLEIKEGQSRVTGEGRSLYFYDHDKHLFELHTGTRAERLERYAKG